MYPTRVVDLSCPIGPDTQVYPGDPEPRITPAATIAADGFNVAHVSMGSQSGTHADAPYHFAAAGARIDEMDLSLFLGPGVFVDATGHGARQPITWADIEPRAGRLGPGAVVLLHTGWSRHYGGPDYFAHPYLDGEAARRLVDLGVRTVGIDAPNLDETPDEEHPGDGWPVHRAFAAAGGALVENLSNLERVDFPDPLISVLPIKLAGGDGAPVRAVAIQLPG